MQYRFDPDKVSDERFVDATRLVSLDLFRRFAPSCSFPYRGEWLASFHSCIKLVIEDLRQAYADQRPPKSVKEFFAEHLHQDLSKDVFVPYLGWVCFDLCLYGQDHLHLFGWSLILTRASHSELDWRAIGMPGFLAEELRHSFRRRMRLHLRFKRVRQGCLRERLSDWDADIFVRNDWSFTDENCFPLDVFENTASLSFFRRAFTALLERLSTDEITFLHRAAREWGCNNQTINLKDLKHPTDLYEPEY